MLYQPSPKVGTTGTKLHGVQCYSSWCVEHVGPLGSSVLPQDEPFRHTRSTDNNPCTSDWIYDPDQRQEWVALMQQIQREGWTVPAMISSSLDDTLAPDRSAYYS